MNEVNSLYGYLCISAYVLSERSEASLSCFIGVIVMSVLNSLVFCAVNVKLALEALVLMSEEVLDDEELVECAYVNEGVAAL